MLVRAFIRSNKHHTVADDEVSNDSGIRNDNQLPATVSRGLIDRHNIPEPTRSLIFVTDEPLSKVENSVGITMRVTVMNDGVEFDDAKSFFAEPSLIWTRMPIEPNDGLIEEPMYYPAYSALSPIARYQYISWLKDISRPTNLSYVFLYFYGLERHLLIGNYDLAVDEIVKLVRYHDKPSFVRYATNSLVVASLAKNRLDIVERAPFILDQEENTVFAFRLCTGGSTSPRDVIDIANRVGFKNRRYIRLQPRLFESAIQKQINIYEKHNGSILDSFGLNNFKKVKASVFANMSIPERYRDVLVPDILGNKMFQETFREILEKAHLDVKEQLVRKRKKS